MKRGFLLLFFASAFFYCIAQPVTNNVQIGLANNGANGSNGGSGATFEVAFRPLTGYGSSIAAEDFIFYLRAPQSALTGTETVTIVERANIFGSGTMDYQGKVDIGSNTYFLFALNSAAGLNLSLLTVGSWRYAFTFQITPAPSASNKALFRIIDQTNNAELSGFAGQTVFTQLLMQGANQLTSSAFNLLPAILSDFNVSKKGSGDAILNWTTTIEQNVSHFVLERSSSENTSNWVQFGKVQAVGNSNTPTKYTYTDVNIYDGNVASKIVFYRIRAVDLDGQEKIFPIRSIRFSALGSKEVNIYPNPARDGFTINIPLPNTLNTNNKVRLNLINRIGQIVHAREISASVASNYYYDIKTPGVISGEYMLQIIFQGELLDTKKVIVQR